MAKLVVKRYATALFDIASSEGKMATYEEEVKVIIKVLQDEPDFMAVLENHKVTTEEKISLLETIFTGKVENSILGLLVLLVKKGRQSEMINVLEGFLERIKKESGIVKATVTSAVALKEGQVEAIKAKLEASTKSKIELETIVDEGIIAGLVIRVGDKVVDASIKGEMQALKKQLSKLRPA
ncbi:ATP synthase F1 subunit delta [Cellulosilyticum lentocellum]|uniref:ATP synthase subunit delta n=1 Tax=Cellulosilyticum lentocellum (strain ATCC 49066 / DSM 5427 / NCIMB 11756 / RHM5) TaxID=642492 RepID=F2JGW5_CELLD|nr:ATP synthase F1 subunit delta [Cellulosilyticum lentocellum]ADZ85305.1 ATP synthase subunit delta [Cellulosilyticum lentocellum DSM 5427]